VKRTAKRWWTRLITALAVLTIAAAAISAGFAVLVDSVPGWRHDVEAQLAQAVGHPARIGTLALTWSGLRPTLDLREVALLDAPAGAPLATLRRLRLGLSPMRLLTGPRTPDRVEADGLSLTVRVAADGRIRVDGIAPRDDDSPTLADALARYAQLRLHEVAITVIDARLDAAPLALRLDHASFRHGRGGYHLDARLAAPGVLARQLDLEAHFDGSLDAPETLHGRWRLTADGLAMPPWLAARLLPGARLAIDAGRVEAAGTLDRGRPGSGSLRLRAGRIDGTLDGQSRAWLAAVDIDARLEPTAGGWRLSLPQAAVSGVRGAWRLDGFEATLAADGARRLVAPLLRLDDLAPWLVLLRLPEPLPGRLADLHGDLGALRVEQGPVPAGDAARPLSLTAELRALGLRGQGEQPGFAALTGTVVADAAQGQLTLAGTPLRLDLPRAFERAVPFDAIRGRLHWQRAPQGWRIESEALDLRFAASGAQGAARLDLHDDGRPPHLKLDLDLQSEAAAALKPWMPKNWGPNSRAWLERAIRQARVTGGHLSLDAALTPRDAGQRPTVPWRLTLDVEDAELAFAPDWPAAVGGRARLEFHDGGLDIRADGGAISGLAVGRLSATIADFHDATLALDADFHGDAANLYRLFRESPLKARLSGLIARTEARGPVRGDLHLRIPLNVPQPQVEAGGRLQLDGVELSVRGLAAPIRALRGSLDYGRSVAAERIDGRLYDTTVVVRIAPEAGSPEPVLSGQAVLEPGRDDGLAAAFIPGWLRAGLSGSTDVALRLPLGGPEAGRLSIDSALHGVVSTLPAPLAKHAGAALPLHLALSGDDGDRGGTRLAIAVADALKATLRFPADDGSGAGTAARSIEVRLGDGSADPEASRDGLYLSGTPDDFDLGGWLGVIASGGERPGSGAGPRFVGADLRAGRTRLRRWTLGPTRWQAQALDAAGAIRVRAEGAATGSIDWQPADGGAVLARLDRLALDALDPLPVPPAGVAPADVPFNPTRAPRFEVEAQDLSVGGVALGRFRLATSRIADGQRIERLAVAGGRLDGSASGAWRRRDGGKGSGDGSSAELRFEVRSDAIAEVLRVFGYTPNLTAEDARFTGNLVWPRVPAGLELSQATGSIDLSLKRGQLKAVEPGAGRVLGLVNLYALPRRLLFDFRDVVDEGLRFDRLKGGFRLADGNAITDDLDIEGTAVRIEMRGRIGLAARDYDQQVTVIPDLSTGVTVGATLLGGPIAGGILLVAQQLFDKPFNPLGSFRYQVTGSWDDPTLLQGAADPPPAAAPVPASEPSSPGARNG
jgi:uncharacterized protein (TIGR02099 family)